MSGRMTAKVVATAILRGRCGWLAAPQWSVP